MGIIFKSLYIYISNLGILTVDIIASFFKAIGKLIHKIFRFNKSSFSSAKTFFKRSIVFLLVAGIAVTSVYFITANSGKTDAYAITLDGEVMGYAQSQSDADHARALVIKSIGSSYESSLVTKELKTEPYNIKSADELYHSLVSKLAPELKKVHEIYIDSEFLCAVTDRIAAKEVFSQKLNTAAKQYPDSTVSFAEEITFQPAYYQSNSTDIWSTEQLKLALKTLDILSLRHAKCEKNLTTVEFDTVEIQTNTLFMGDARIRRPGENGTAYAVDLVTYVGDTKVQSEHIMSVPLINPVSQIVERGIRAESLSIGNYSVLQTTGYFCWPVVGLYTVTSPYGYRSLGYHRGIDISGGGASGSLVVAGASGVVTEAGWSTGGYGNYVIIDHGNGVETLYAHMLDNSLMVNAGDVLTKGQAIGRVGNTGYSFGAHLHFEVRINGNRINPAPYLGLE